MSPTTMSKRVTPMRLILPILAMALIVVAANVGVQFIIADGWLTWGAFTYPLAFLVTDISNRLYGPEDARKVVLWGMMPDWGTFSGVLTFSLVTLILGFIWFMKTRKGFADVV